MSSRRYTSFRLGDGTFGIDILLVGEVIRNPEITPVDLGPDYVAGLLNLRGQIVTIIDLRTRLGLPPLPPGSSPRCLILKTTHGLAAQRQRVEIDDATCVDMVGLLVDDMRDVVTIADDELEPAPNFGALDARFVAGVAKLDDRLLVTLATRTLLATRNEEPDLRPSSIH